MKGFLEFETVIENVTPAEQVPVHFHSTAY